MRSTLTIDDDILAAARYLAQREQSGFLQTTLLIAALAVG